MRDASASEPSSVIQALRATSLKLSNPSRSVTGSRWPSS
jgi:hypothetical protein